MLWDFRAEGVLTLASARAPRTTGMQQLLPLRKNIKAKERLAWLHPNELGSTRKQAHPAAQLKRSRLWPQPPHLRKGAGWVGCSVSVHGG